MKKRSKTLPHLRLERLLDRLPPDYSNRGDIQEQFLKQTAGHFGETTADFYLQYLPGEQYRIIQDLRLFDGIQHFQIDALILCTEFILILEVKNLKGKLIFDLEHSQLFRELNGKKDIFPDPFLQVGHQTIQLSRWLNQFNFPSIPIDSFIVVANPNTIIKTHGRDPQQLKSKIIRAKKLYTMIENRKAHYSHATWTPEQVADLALLMQKENTPYQGGAILDCFNLTVEDLIMGVQCAECRTYPMLRKRDHWYCINCDYKSKDAHLRTLQDYQLLIADKITNPQFRKFACVSSTKVARRLLSESCSHNFGQTQSRKYTISLIE
ncbi:nuclease-related domain-containing protein [Halobacillus ihumii]|uniref:nuclease-related domain-containing protein n=1 Tax=Halobacillus ihumii TaxID=2686092 RepID=UPI0013D59B62|nr:nuclease-related domain-containing protein [Halobacillus ihumii]